MTNLDHLLEQLDHTRLQLEQGGLSETARLEATDYEVRAMDVGRSGNTQVAYVGTKGGSLYQMAFPGKTSVDENLACAKWTSVKLPFTDHPPPLECLRVFQWDGESWLAIGTRGVGVWLVSVSALVADPSCAEFSRLPVGEDRLIRTLLFDFRSETLYAGTHCGAITAYSMEDRTPRFDVRIKSRLSDLAIDYADGDDGLEDFFFVATAAGEIFRFWRDGATDPFLLSDLESKSPFFTRHGAGFEQLIPLSAYRLEKLSCDGGSPERLYPERGVVAMSMNHLRVIFIPLDKGVAAAHARPDLRDDRVEPELVQIRMLGNLQTLCAAVVRFPDGCLTLVSGLDKKLYVIETAQSTGYGRTAAGLLSGSIHVMTTRDRVFAIAAVPRSPEAVSGKRILLAGRGDHSVRAGFIQNTSQVSAKEKELLDRIRSLVPGESAVAAVHTILTCEPHRTPLRKTLIHLLPSILSDEILADDKTWHFLHDLVFDVRDNRDVIIDFLRSLRIAEGRCPLSRDRIELFIVYLRKFLLDGPSYSAKRNSRLQLLDINAKINPDDAIAYAAILASNNYDPIFRIDFTSSDHFGEVQTFCPLLRPAHQDPPWYEPGETEEDRPLLFVATLRGGFWLIDTYGKHPVHIPTPSDWGLVHAIGFVGPYIALAFGDHKVRRTSRQRLLDLWNRRRSEEEFSDDRGASAREVMEELELQPDKPYRLSNFCPIPGQKRSYSSHCVVGDSRGLVFRVDIETGQCEQLGAVEPFPGEGRSLTHIGSCELCVPESPFLPFLVVATTSGSIHLFRWSEKSEELEEHDRVMCGRSEVTVLLWPRPGDNCIVVASRAGLASCYRVVLEKENDENRLRLRLRWTYRAEKGIHDVHLNHLPDNRGECIVLGSHDECLHVLDPSGRLEDLIRIPGIPFHRFALAPPREGAPREDLGRVFVAGYENVVAGLSVLDRPAMRARAARMIEEYPGGVTEEARLRWRGMRLREGYLRRYYYRTTDRFDDAQPEKILDEIDRLFDSAYYGSLATSVLRSLFSRLFLGRPKSSSRGGSNLRYILDSPKMIDRVGLTFRQTRDRWDLPGSANNVRVLGEWIRSSLSAIDSIETLNLWRDAPGLQERESGFDLTKLLTLFLHYPNPQLQHRTVRELELLFLGGESIAPRDSKLRAPLLATGCVQEARFLSDLLLARLAWRPEEEIQEQETDWIVLEVGRILRSLREKGLFNPLVLLCEAALRELPPALLRVLANQEQASSAPVSGSDEALSPILDLLRRGAELLEAVRNFRTAREDLLSPLLAVVELASQFRTMPVDEDATDTRAAEVSCFLRIVHSLFQANNISELSKITLPDLCSTENHFRSNGAFEEFGKLIRLTADYDRNRELDIYGSYFEALNYDDVAQMLEQLRVVHEAIDSPHLTEWERRILCHVYTHWETLIRVEREQQLIIDFIAALENATKDWSSTDNEPLSSSNAMDLVWDQDLLRVKALNNLFTRLTLVGNPDRAVLVYVQSTKEKGTLAQPVLFEHEGTPDTVRGQFQRSEKPTGDLPSSWWDAAQVENMDYKSIEGDLKSLDPGHWVIETIHGRGDLGPRTLGFLALGWSQQDHPDRTRYDHQRLLRALVVQTMSFRQIEIDQKAFVTRFYSLVAHDLRNPIASFTTSAGILEAGHLDGDSIEKRREYYARMNQQGAHMVALVDGMMSFRGEPVLPRLQNAKPTSIVYEAVKDCRANYDSRIIDFDKDAYKTLTIISDPSWIRQIVQNLLINALKYSEQGPVRIEISPTQGGLEIRVSDRGRGVPKEERKRIFEPFVRGASIDYEKISGLGLGLYISQMYARGLNGRIQVRGDPLAGSIFTLYLPEISEGN